MAEQYDFRLILGPHSPMSEPLQVLLGNNAAALSEVRAEYPKTKLHRDVMTKTLALPMDALARPTVLQAHVDAVRTRQTTKCLIYNYDAFLGSRKSAVRAGFLYAGLETKVPPLRQLTSGHQVTIFLCLQTMTQFVEFELSRTPHFRHVTETYPHGMDFSWVHFVHRLKEAWPEALIVAFDADRIAPNWAGIAALVTGHPNAHTFERINRFPISSLAEDGRRPFREALQSSPPADVPEWMALAATFYQEYGPHVPILRKVMASPWSDSQVAHAQARFAADMDALTAMENVALIEDVEWLTE